MITNSRLLELRTTANLCQDVVDRKCATVLEQDFCDFYNAVNDHLFGDRQHEGDGQAHFPLLFGK